MMEKFHSFDLRKRLNKFWKKISHCKLMSVWKEKIVQSMRKLDSEIFFFRYFFSTEKFYWESIMYGNSSFRDDFCLLCFIYVQYSLAEFCVGGLFFFSFRFFRHNKNWWFSLSLLLNFKWCKIRGAPLVIFLRIVPLSFWILHNFLGIDINSVNK